MHVGTGYIACTCTLMVGFIFSWRVFLGFTAIAAVDLQLTDFISHLPKGETFNIHGRKNIIIAINDPL